MSDYRQLRCLRKNCDCGVYVLRDVAAIAACEPASTACTCGHAPEMHGHFSDECALAWDGWCSDCHPVLEEP